MLKFNNLFYICFIFVKFDSKSLKKYKGTILYWKSLIRILKFASIVFVVLY
jgi:hypothetical protein